MIKDASQVVTKNLEERVSIFTFIANDVTLKDPNISDADKVKHLETYFKLYSEKYGITALGYINADGYLTSIDGYEKDVSDCVYYTVLKNGQTYINEPRYNPVTGKYAMFTGALIKDGDTFVGAVTCRFDSDYLASLINGLKYYNIGTAYMLNAKGTVIASEDAEEVSEEYNLIEAAKEEKSLQEIAEIQKRMIQGQSNVEKFNDGINKFVVYTNVEGSDGWSMAFEVPESAVLVEVGIINKLLVVVATLGIIVIAGAIWFLGRRISEQIKLICSQLKVYATGDFTQLLEDELYKREDELGVMSQSIREMVAGFKVLLSSVKEDVVVLNNEDVELEQISERMIQGSMSIATTMQEAIQTNLWKLEKLMKKWTNLVIILN